jgi:hypothetical protein
VVNFLLLSFSSILPTPNYVHLSNTIIQCLDYTRIDLLLWSLLRGCPGHVEEKDFQGHHAMASMYNLLKVCTKNYASMYLHWVDVFWIFVCIFIWYIKMDNTHPTLVEPIFLALQIFFCEKWLKLNLIFMMKKVAFVWQDYKLLTRPIFKGVATYDLANQS